MGTNRIAGAGKPLLVAPELLQRFSGKKFSAVARWMSKWFQQASRDEDWNLMYLKTKKPSRLRGVEAGRGNFPAQKLSLMRDLVHTPLRYQGSNDRWCIKYTTQPITRKNSRN
jgi:hypothetical protein